MVTIGRGIPSPEMIVPQRGEGVKDAWAAFHPRKAYGMPVADFDLTKVIDAGASF
jgi:hypothetical protein